MWNLSWFETGLCFQQNEFLRSSYALLQWVLEKTFNCRDSIQRQDWFKMPHLQKKRRWSGTKKIVSKQEYERYDLLRFNNFLKTSPDFRWCSGTNCGSGQEVDGGGSNSFFTCAKCLTKTCFHHKVVWHTGLTCRDYDYWIIQNEDNATSNYIAMNTKQCPKCQSVVEKDGGCDHMTCKPPGGCSFEFCWLCLANFGPIRQDGNHRHNPSCQYYAAYDGWFSIALMRCYYKPHLALTSLLFECTVHLHHIVNGKHIKLVHRTWSSVFSIWNSVHQLVEANRCIRN